MALINGTNGDDVKDGTDASDTMHGFGGSDTLHGKLLNDKIFGDDGNDFIFGDEGDDSLDGGTQTGNDSDELHGGDGSDTLTYGKVQFGMTVDLAQHVAQGGGNLDAFDGIENATGTNFADKLTGDGGNNILQGAGGNDTMDGGAGADKLNGSVGHDTMNGGAGKDTLIGSLDFDTLTGGGDADTFQYFQAASTFSAGDSGVGAGKHDIITDFVHGVDKIDLHLIDAKAGAGDQAFSFVGSNAFSGEGQVRVFTENGNTFVQASNDADTVAELEIQLNGAIKLDQNDFVL
jgi:serralysin